MLRRRDLVRRYLLVYTLDERHRADIRVDPGTRQRRGAAATAAVAGRHAVGALQDGRVVLARSRGILDVRVRAQDDLIDDGAILALLDADGV